MLDSLEEGKRWSAMSDDDVDIVLSWWVTLDIVGHGRTNVAWVRSIQLELYQDFALPVSVSSSSTKDTLVGYASLLNVLVSNRSSRPVGLWPHPTV